jgi:hypothetical protein
MHCQTRDFQIACTRSSSTGLADVTRFDLVDMTGLVLYLARTTQADTDETRVRDGRAWWVIWPPSRGAIRQPNGI